MEYQWLNSGEKYSAISSPEKLKKQSDVKQTWETGQIIDEKYEILDILAKDDRKIIHKVRHCQWNILLAVRSQIERESQVRFFHQAERWVELGKHPNVVSAYYVQHIGGIPRLFVEYVSNAKTLDKFFSNKEYNTERVLDVAIQICWGMDHAHKKGLLHGDLRPGNIFITDEGEAKITDFRSREDVAIEYTPYMPPEQFEKDVPVQPAIDIYAFGVILYELCASELPFKLDMPLDGEEALDCFRNMILTQPPQTPYQTNPKVPAELSKIIMSCMVVEPQKRPKEFGHLAEAMQEIYLQTTGFVYPREKPDQSSLIAGDLNNRALSLLDLGEEDKAYEYLEQAVNADPLCTGAIINLCLLKLRKKKATLAQLRSETQSLLNLDPEVVTFYRNKICLEEGGFLEESFAETKNTSEKFPSNKEISRLYGMLLLRLGRYEEGEKVFDDLVNTEMPSKKDIYYLIFCCLEEGKKKKAQEIWQKAQALYAYDPYFLLLQGVIMAMQGKVEDAYSHFQSISSTENFWVLLNLAEITAAFGNYIKPYKKATANKEDAAKLYEKLLKKAPQLPRVIRGTQSIWNFPPELKASEPNAEEICPKWSYVRGMPEHKEGVHCMAISPDGRLVVAGGGNSQLRIWEIETGRCKNVLQGHSEGTSQICISYDGHFAVSIGRDSVAFVWDLITGECVAKLEGHVRDITSIAMTCTGYLITGSVDKTLRIWDLGALSCKKILRGHTDKINSVAVTPNGRLAISASEDGRVGIWEIEQGISLQFLEEHSQGVTCLAVSPDGEWLCTGSWDQKIRIFEIKSGKRTAVLEGHEGTLNCLAITPDSKKVISGSEDKTVRIWDIKKGECVHTLTGHTVDVTCLAISPNGSYLISGSWDYTLRIWNMNSGKCLSVLEGHTDLVNAVLITSDERFILSGGDDTILRIWTDITTLSCPILPEPPLSYLLQRPRSKHANFELQNNVETQIGQAQAKIQENKTGEAMGIYREIQTMEGFQHNSRVLDLIYDLAHDKKLVRENPLTIWKSKVLEGHSGPISSICVSRQENIIISGSKDCTLKVWDIKKGTCLYTLKGHEGAVTSIDISPNNRFIVSGSHDQTVRLWELETGRCIHAMQGHEHWVEHVKFTLDGRRVISGSRDNTIKIWERKTGHRLYSLNNHTDLISALKITPDGKYIVSASHDRTIRIWEAESGQSLQNLEKHVEHVKCLDCLPEQYDKAISGGWDGNLYLWDIQKGECITSFLGHENWVNAVSVVDGGKKVISCSLDKTIRVWDTATGQCLAILTGHKHDVNNIFITSDGKFCISSSWDNSLRVWDLEKCECRYVLQIPNGDITTMQGIYDTRYIITGSKDGKLIVWELDWDWEIPSNEARP